MSDCEPEFFVTPTSNSQTTMETPDKDEAKVPGHHDGTNSHRKSKKNREKKFKMELSGILKIQLP